MSSCSSENDHRAAHETRPYVCEVTATARTYRLDQFVGFWVMELAGNVQQRDILSRFVLYL